MLNNPSVVIISKSVTEPVLHIQPCLTQSSGPSDIISIQKRAVRIKEENDKESVWISNVG